MRKVTMFMLLAVGCCCWLLFATKGQAQVKNCPYVRCVHVLCYTDPYAGPIYGWELQPNNSATWAQGDFPCSSWCWEGLCSEPPLGVLSYIDPHSGEVDVVGTVRKEDIAAFMALIPKGATIAQAKRFASTITLSGRKALLTDAEVTEATKDSKPCEKQNGGSIEN